MFALQPLKRHPVPKPVVDPPHLLKARLESLGCLVGCHRPRPSIRPQEVSPPQTTIARLPLDRLGHFEPHPSWSGSLALDDLQSRHDDGEILLHPRTVFLLVTGALQANHVSDGTCDTLCDLVAYD
ncbi:hypothetical protein B296_00026927 [Ensete ventricosum]|uniref:Uncharacterized protein n=1 Tax=Ensete ventricosum TaxID=4639 RepID=A0A426XBB1_ENSVE|nr:hypothetical protein B296_00026927 [Ensete ventricosum]